MTMNFNQKLNHKCAVLQPYMPTMRDYRYESRCFHSFFLFASQRSYCFYHFIDSLQCILSCFLPANAFETQHNTHTECSLTTLTKQMRALVWKCASVKMCLTTILWFFTYALNRLLNDIPTNTIAYKPLGFTKPAIFNRIFFCYRKISIFFFVKRGKRDRI